LNKSAKPYIDYTAWKGWDDKSPFGSISPVERECFKYQLDKYNIEYKNINALEIGFGNGGFIKFLLENNSTVTGLEIQEEQLEKAQHLGIETYSLIENIANKKYDLIVGFDVLEHLSITELQNFFSKAESLLAKDGVMFFRFPNADSFAGMIAQNGDYTHITAIGISKLQQLLRPVGLNIIHFDGAILYPKRFFVHGIRALIRKVITKTTGVGNHYFFAGNVVAVVGRQLGDSEL
jgi:2-polyprenyl-3-methyl-5-hydroxy-6-metoxy-1,4-benzoquinol methylase